MSKHSISMTVNGETISAEIEARTTLGDFLRDELGLTGTHLACEHGVCGACTVIVDGDSVRSCLMLAVQTDGKTVCTIEGVAPLDAPLHPIQQALREEFGLQCGFCTPGIVMSLMAVLESEPDNPEEAMIDAVGGHICRCTGYQGIRRAVRRLAAARQGKPA